MTGDSLEEGAGSPAERPSAHAVGNQGSVGASSYWNGMRDLGSVMTRSDTRGDILLGQRHV